MLDKIKEGISNLEYFELKELQKELSNGSQTLSRLVSSRIHNMEKDTGCICPVCSSVIDPSKKDSFTLIFGPNNLKKKVSFCAIDCLQYFISKSKQVEVSQR